MEIWKLLFPKMFFSFAGDSGAGGAGAEGDEHQDAGKGGTGGEGGEGGATDDDPEVEIAGQKYKTSEVNSWRSKAEDYSNKLNDLTEKEAGLQDFVNMANVLRRDPAKLERVLAIVEGKLDRGEVTTGSDEGDDALKRVLGSLSDEEPSHQAIKFIINSMQKLKSDVQYFRDRDTKQDEEATVAQARKDLNEGITAFQSSKDIKFDTDDEKGLHKRLVLTHMMNSGKKYNSFKELQADVQGVAKHYYDQLATVREKSLKKYIESKRGTPPVTGGEGSGKEVKPTMETLTEVLEKELSTANKED